MGLYCLVMESDDVYLKPLSTYILSIGHKFITNAALLYIWLCIQFIDICNSGTIVNSGLSCTMCAKNLNKVGKSNYIYNIFTDLYTWVKYMYVVCKILYYINVAGDISITNRAVQSKILYSYTVKVDWQTSKLLL
jgi:hypothetical protein